MSLLSINLIVSIHILHILVIHIIPILLMSKLTTTSATVTMGGEEFSARSQI